MTPRPIPAVSISEAAWQEQAITLAHFYGWHHLHVRRSIGKGRKWVTSTNLSGWPDLFLWHPKQRRTLALELKSEAGKATRAQQDVLSSLAESGVESWVLRPSDLDLLNRILSPAGAPVEEEGP